MNGKCRENLEVVDTQTTSLLTCDVLEQQQQGDCGDAEDVSKAEKQ